MKKTTTRQSLEAMSLTELRKLCQIVDFDCANQNDRAVLISRMIADKGTARRLTKRFNNPYRAKLEAMNLKALRSLQKELNISIPGSSKMAKAELVHFLQEETSALSVMFGTPTVMDYVGKASKSKKAVAKKAPKDFLGCDGGSRPSEERQPEAAAAKKTRAKVRKIKAEIKTVVAKASKAKPKAKVRKSTRKTVGEPTAAAKKAKKGTNQRNSLGVAATWAKIFEANEANFLAKGGRRNHLVLADPGITEAMQAAFPGRESEVFKQVALVRGRYNRGALFSDDSLPPRPSHRYMIDGNDKAVRTTARGKKIEKEQS